MILYRYYLNVYKFNYIYYNYNPAPDELDVDTIFYFLHSIKYTLVITLNHL